MSQTPPAANTYNFSQYTDAQLRHTISTLSSAVGNQQPIPVQPSAVYQQNLAQWSSSANATPKGAIASQRGTRSRATRSTLAPATQQSYSRASPVPPARVPTPGTAPAHAPQMAMAMYPPHAVPGSRHPLPTSTQALHTTYPSRMRTGATLLMQPILAGPSAAGASAARGSRRGAVNYTDPGSGDDIPDAGELESDDSDFVASGGVRQSIRASRLASKMSGGMSVFQTGGGSGARTPQPGTPAPPGRGKDLDQSYLGAIPPARFITAKPVAPTRHEYFPEEQLAAQATKPTSLVPIRVEFETDTHRIRDCFVWNLHEQLIKPEAFARIFCADLEIPQTPWAHTVASQIRAQLEDHEGVASMDLAVGDEAMQEEPEGAGPVEELPECRVIVGIDVQIDTHHLVDHIEWDLLSPLTPEEFAQTTCAELGLAGESAPLIAHAVHEELIKHKKDAVEWGVIGGDVAPASKDAADDGAPRDKSGLGLVKDKTGLGLGWGRTPKDGRGPKRLVSVWRDWAEAEEYSTRFEVLTTEEVERREIERERASRRLRRETSKFQSMASTRRRR